MAYSLGDEVGKEDPVVRLKTLDEVAEELRVSKAAIYRWVAEGRIEPTRVGNRLRFTEDALGRFLSDSALDHGRIASSRVFDR